MQLDENDELIWDDRKSLDDKPCPWVRAVPLSANDFELRL
jgi:hypothetical protein